MKKIIFVFSLIMMGLAFNMNAQNVSDTVYYIDTVQFVVNNDSVTELYGGQTEIASMCIGSMYAPENVVMSFKLDSITEDMHVAIKIGDYATSCYVPVSVIDSLFEYTYGDSIIRIDSVYLHPGVYEYDTVYNVIDSVMVYDTITNMQSIIRNGYNEINLNDFFTIDSFDCVEVYITWGDAYENYIVRLTDVYIVDNRTDVDIEDIEDEVYNVYPNPSNHIVYIQGEYRKVTVYNQAGQKVIESSNTGMVDISKLPNGLYIFRIDNSQPIKVIKM